VLAVVVLVELRCGPKASHPAHWNLQLALSVTLRINGKWGCTIRQQRRLPVCQFRGRSDYGSDLVRCGHVCKVVARVQRTRRARGSRGGSKVAPRRAKIAGLRLHADLLCPGRRRAVARRSGGRALSGPVHYQVSIAQMADTPPSPKSSMEGLGGPEYFRKQELPSCCAADLDIVGKEMTIQSTR
jgi:hypothetical protein